MTEKMCYCLIAHTRVYMDNVAQGGGLQITNAILLKELARDGDLPNTNTI